MSQPERQVIPVEPILHYNPLLVTVLPKERRARHVYQLGAMLCLFTLGLWQLTIGVQPTSAVNVLDQHAYNLLNWVCVVGGGGGVVAALVPERIVRWYRVSWDATYFRLYEELGCHLMLVTVWFSYGLTVWSSFGFIKGYSFGLAAAIWFGGAALGRAFQILLTLYRAGMFGRAPSAIVSSDHPAAPDE